MQTIQSFSIGELQTIDLELAHSSNHPLNLSYVTVETTDFHLLTKETNIILSL